MQRRWESYMLGNRAGENRCQSHLNVELFSGLSEDVGDMQWLSCVSEYVIDDRHLGPTLSLALECERLNLPEELQNDLELLFEQ